MHHYITKISLRSSQSIEMHNEIYEQLKPTNYTNGRHVLTFGPNEDSDSGIDVNRGSY